MTRYIAVLLDIETGEAITTIVIEAETAHDACVKAPKEADDQGYELGEAVTTIVREA